MGAVPPASGRGRPASDTAPGRMRSWIPAHSMDSSVGWREPFPDVGCFVGWWAALPPRASARSKSSRPPRPASGTTESAARMDGRAAPTLSATRAPIPAEASGAAGGARLARARTDETGAARSVARRERPAATRSPATASPTATFARSRPRAPAGDAMLRLCKVAFACLLTEGCTSTQGAAGGSFTCPPGPRLRCPSSRVRRVRGGVDRGSLPRPQPGRGTVDHPGDRPRPPVPPSPSRSAGAAGWPADGRPGRLH